MFNSAENIQIVLFKTSILKHWLILSLSINNKSIDNQIVTTHCIGHPRILSCDLNKSTWHDLTELNCAMDD